MYAYMYVYIFIYIHIYIFHIHTYIYIYVYIYIHIYMFIHYDTYLGAGHGQLATPSGLRALIRNAGKVPVQRRTDYTVYKTFSTDGDVSSTDSMEVDLLDGIDPIETFGSYQSLIKKDDNRFKNIFSSRKNGAVRTYHSMRNINNYTNINNSNDNMHGHNDHSNKSNSNNVLYDNKNERKLNKFKIDRNEKIVPQRRLISSISRSTNHLDSDPYSQPPSEFKLIRNPENLKTEKDVKIITYSSSYTIVPTYECFNVCTYCNFRYICKYIYICICICIHTGIIFCK
jgi:hypothetical protein